MSDILESTAIEEALAVIDQSLEIVHERSMMTSSRLLFSSRGRTVASGNSATNRLMDVELNINY